MNLEERLDRAKQHVEAWATQWQHHNAEAQNHGQEAAVAQQQVNHWSARVTELEEILKDHRAETEPAMPELIEA